MRGRIRPVAGGLVLSLFLGGCAVAPSTLDPRGIRAAQVIELGWLMFILAGAVFAVTMGLLAVALWRPRPRVTAAADIAPPADRGFSARLGALGGNTLVVVGGLVVPSIVLLALFILNLRTMVALAVPSEPYAVTVEVIGHQFWWEVRYPDHDIVTANEIHVPVGRPVSFIIRSEDVIHSFWVAQLAGKIDMIPGQTNRIWMQADEPGVYWGQCTELCGLAHAKMAFVLVALPQEEFDAWLARERQPAQPPTDPFLLRGAAAFSQHECIRCHQIRYGTQRIGGQIGPDLTHVGGRLTIAAGMLPNNVGNLAGWIGNPQAIKPGNHMPVIPIGAEDLRALAYYLESLK